METQKRSLRCGDIVLVLYAKRIGKGEYRLGRILQVHPDAHNIVRTVTVGMRPRDKREDPKTYVKKPLEELEVGVQRVVVISPVEEQIQVGDDTSAKETGSDERGADVVAENDVADVNAVRSCEANVADKDVGGSMDPDAEDSTVGADAEVLLNRCGTAIVIGLSGDDADVIGGLDNTDAIQSEGDVTGTTDPEVMQG